jgi:16S rRNA (cytosine967-C5)-methyltransferase
MSEGKKRQGRGRPGASDPSPNGSRRRGSGPTLARLIAVRVLERVERVRAYADLALHHALAQSNLASNDRALATDLVYGTLRWRGRIDHHLRALLDRPLDEVEPLVLTTLRIGAYQILFSTRIPDNAAVDEAVRCARAVGAERATGLVNAVLRRLARERDAISFPSAEEDPVGHLQHALSLPRWIAERWLADYGLKDAARLAEACNHPPPLTARVNPRKTTREALLEKLRPLFPDAMPCALASQGIVLGRKGDPGRDPLFREGAYTVQDEASQLVVELLDPQPDDRVLDVCAAPGTKTSAIAERLGESGSVLALDRHARRLNLIARNVRRLELPGVSTLVRDATRSLQDLPLAAGEPTPDAGAHFDRVLVDAPCSGLGAMRRNPDARWRVRMEDLASLAKVQGAILARAADVLSPGGRLVYSTCTVMSEENEDVVQDFLREHTNFRLIGRDELPAHLHPVLDHDGFMRCHPHLHDTDGFFAACLTRIS